MLEKLIACITTIVLLSIIFYNIIDASDYYAEYYLLLALIINFVAICIINYRFHRNEPVKKIVFETLKSFAIIIGIGIIVGFIALIHFVKNTRWGN